MKNKREKLQVLHDIAENKASVGASPVLEVCPKTGEYINVKPIEVNDRTRIMRILNPKRGYVHHNNKFIREMARHVRYGRVLSDKQLDICSEILLKTDHMEYAQSKDKQLEAKEIEQIYNDLKKHNLRGKKKIV